MKKQFNITIHRYQSIADRILRQNCTDMLESHSQLYGSLSALVFGMYAENILLVFLHGDTNDQYQILKNIAHKVTPFGEPAKLSSILDEAGIHPAHPEQLLDVLIRVSLRETILLMHECQNEVAANE